MLNDPIDLANVTVVRPVLPEGRPLKFPGRPGAVYHRQINRTQDVTVYPSLFGGAWVGVGPSNCNVGYDHSRSFASTEQAIAFAHGLGEDYISGL